MSNKERRKAPVLRFKGFTDDWKQRKWKDILLVNSGKDYKHLSRGSIPVYGTGGYMLSVDKELSNVDAIGIGRKGTIDHPQYLKAPFWTVDTLFFMTPKNDINIDFAFGLSQTINWKKYDESTGLPSLSKKSIDNISIKLPNYNEQIKIGRIISQIDNVISLQQRKTQLLNKVIKYLTQNLFIQSDSLTPVLRFLSFNKKWTSTKIGKIMDVGAVKRIHQSDWRESGIPFYRARDIIAIRQNKELPSPIYISHEQYENYSETSGKVNMNDLLVTGVGTIGVPLLVKKTPIYFKDGNIIWLKNSNKLNGNFLFYVFQSSKIQDYIHSIAGVGTVPTYTIDSAKKTPIVFPEKSEQTDIANLLNTVTNMVHMSKSKKRVLMSIKNYLLQNMFI